MRRLLLSIILLSATAATPVAAQNDAVGLRVDKLEKEMRAVQRKVFPNGVPVTSEIGSPSATDAGPSSSGPMADMTARVDALEAQLKTLTGQVETDGNRIKKLEDAIKAMRADYDKRLAALEGGVVGGGESDPPAKTAAKAPTPLVAPAKPTPPKPKPVLAAPASAPTKTTPLRADPARKSAIAAVELPSTGDAAEDAYTYGFRLWTAKLYPEAQVKLKEFVGKYPKHKRTSYAQNLLGRAYLDEGKPALASVAFYDNYTKNPKGDRASESLYFLGVALTKLKKLPDACKVYDEFGDVYGGSASSDLKAKVAKGRADAKCAA
jgi:TolA-binding protein